MQIITRNENEVVTFLKDNREKYPDEISMDIIKEGLDLSELKVADLSHSLEKKHFVKVSDKTITYDELDQEVKVVADKSAVKRYMLNKNEEDAYEIIREVIARYDNFAPKYILEGALLYGELELTPKRTYNILVSLENRQLLKKIQRADGEYYTI